MCVTVKVESCSSRFATSRVPIFTNCVAYYKAYPIALKFIYCAHKFMNCARITKHFGAFSRCCLIKLKNVKIYGRTCWTKRCLFQTFLTFGRCVSCVNYPSFLSDCNKNWVVSINCSKILHYEISRVVTCRRTEMAKPTGVGFCNRFLWIYQERSNGEWFEWFTK
jgi:hypothetical protein